MELLVPAGHNVSLIRKLIDAGADAIYFGVQSTPTIRQNFSTRPSFCEFDLPSVRKIVRLIHDAGRRAYVTMNIMYHASQMDAMLELAARLYDLGVDAIIVGDPGFASRLSQVCPDGEIHVSIMGQTLNADTAAFWKELHASRIVLDYNISLEEVIAIKQKAKIQVELIVYGSYCFHFHKICSLSNYFYGQMCFGPCIEKAVVQGLRQAGSNPFRSKFLNAYNALPAMHEGGIDAIKIEGRQKSPRYMVKVLSILRPAVDALNRGEPLPAEPKNSRLFLTPPNATGGFYLGEPNIPQTLTSESSLRYKVSQVAPYLHSRGLVHSYKRKRFISKAFRNAHRSLPSSR